jgi:hypothetical protein
MRLVLAVLILGFLSANCQAQIHASKSQWVYADAKGKLTYKALPSGFFLCWI